MNIYVQDGYERFACLAGDCRHTCCQIWDILIDSDTAAAYQAKEGPLGEKLRESMYQRESETYFELNQQGFCHFLRQDGLCDLVVQHGDGMLCRLCREFPRFSASFSGRREMRLSISCEAAGRLLLSRTEKARWVLKEGEETQDDLTPREKGFISWRQGLYDVIQYRELPLAMRLSIITPPDKQDRLMDHLPLLCGQNHLLPQWTELLRDLQSAPETWQEAELPQWLDIPLEQFAFYVFTRSLYPVRTVAKRNAQLRHCLLMIQLMRALCARHTARYGEMDMEQLIEYARLYSIEMEHSYVNANMVRDALEQDELAATV